MVIAAPAAPVEGFVVSEAAVPDAAAVVVAADTCAGAAEEESVVGAGAPPFKFLDH